MAVENRGQSRLDAGTIPIDDEIIKMKEARDEVGQVARPPIADEG
jgi:hypothetical protein